MTHPELGNLEKSKERYLFDPKSFNPKSFPRLRPGVKFFKISDANNQQFSSGIYIGFNHRGVELKSEIAYQLLQRLDGTQSLENILRLVSMNAFEPGIDPNVNEVTHLLQVLSDANLIEFRSAPVSLQLLRNKSTTDKSDLLPINLINSFNRMQAEENLYGWHPAVTIEKESQTLISQRRKFAIVIFSRNS